MLEFQQNGGIMKKYFEKYGNIPLFEGISQEDLDILFGCLNAKIMNFEKDRAVFSAGECVKQFGIVLSGQVSIVHNDYYGNRSILSKVSGTLFKARLCWYQPSGKRLLLPKVNCFFWIPRFASTCVRMRLPQPAYSESYKNYCGKNINLIEKLR